VRTGATKRCTDRLCFGLVADPAAVPDIAGLAAAIQQEAAELGAAAET
jgi:hypothetical protein